MTSTASDADQQWLRQSCTPPILHADTLPPCDGEAPSGPGASQDTAIVIPEDSDTEDEGYGGEDFHSPQSYTTTATSIATHFDSMSTKHRSTGADAVITMDTTPTESVVGVEGDRIRVHDTHWDTPAGPEPDAQSLCQTNSTSAGDVDFGSPSTNTESQPCSTVPDEQFITEAIPVIPATSEPVVMTAKDGSGKEYGDGSQNVPITPSRCTYSPIAATPEVTIQAPPSDSEACPSAERDDATRVHNPSSSPEMSPESPPDQVQGQDRESCSSSDTESGSSEAENGSLLGTTCSASCEGLSRHRSRRTSLRTREMVQDKGGRDTDAEDSDSEDGLDALQRGRDEDYCPSSPGVQRYDSEDDHEDEELNRRKRRKVCLPPYASPLSALSARQIRSTRSTTRSPRRHRTSHSLAMPQTGAISSDVDTCVSRFEEWPLSNVCLKRITEGNRTTF
ncbi:hypothetical protein NCS52_01481500 [Fusarium sp. LHS14.1]|nr:hypothetical protein NCS52_01481500 [Fusarium sp. LHS14.1]